MDYTERDIYGMYRPREKFGSLAEAAPGLVGADALLGSDVYSQKNEFVGVVKEIMLDMQSGRVARVVLSIGHPSINETLFNAPWRAFMFDPAHKRFVLNVEKMKLRPIPEGSRRRSPDQGLPVSDGDYGGGLD
ncbi:PRC-barrel domain-containing protein [Chromobacterium vaccinii]|uniref:Uncharacterized protein n=1 Tax=Chromobacterium vaccinii TaxID=1108595 RepID=A0A1D9LCY2_9NEIS|nr:PRC-barrel domain-containing protein [Chromobacterium vaccinii]AOZ49105.1 hypothetical protein BKX93_03205 [Chromobacterium vaccinii]QND85083.1 Uncharacterized protein ChrSW_2857 [Chromobacterium vaccinii]QND90314.1 Uncharacterized protein ChrSV_2857 [Chromobacterium vaccinii]SUX55336.1 PRC-barrel domain [Chromobacterium vaccinii]